MNEWIRRANETWQNFAPRERLLLSIAGGSMAIVLVYLLAINPFLAARDEAAYDAQGADTQLEAMIRLRREYDNAKARLASLEARIRSNRDHRNMLTLLEALAGEAGVKVESMEERQSGTDDAYRETRVEVTLKKVTLEQVTKYLHSIESASRPFSIKSLRIKKRSDASQLLDADFSVSSFETI